MVKLRNAAYHLIGVKYKELQDIAIIKDLEKPAESAYSKSPEQEAHGKLTPKDVYSKIVDGEFFISDPELTKTTRASVSQCWRRGMKLVLERTEEGKYN